MEYGHSVATCMHSRGTTVQADTYSAILSELGNDCHIYEQVCAWPRPLGHNVGINLIASLYKYMGNTIAKSESRMWLNSGDILHAHKKR